MRRETLIITGIMLAAVAAGVFALLSNKASVIPDTSAAIVNDQPSAVSVPFTKIVQGSKSKVTDRVNYVITTTDELTSLWKLVDAAGAPPAVDFKTQAVIAVFAGTASTSSIAVAKIEDTTTRMVSIAITTPDSTCAKKPLTTSPYEIVSIPATSLPLAHEDVMTTVSCPE